jgi:hypothetical protein
MNKQVPLWVYGAIVLGGGIVIMFSFIGLKVAGL